MCVDFVRAVLFHTNEDSFGKSHTFLVCTHSKVEECMSFLHKHLLDLAWAPQVCAVPCNMLSHLTTFQKHLCIARTIWLSTFSSNRSMGWRSGECRVRGTSLMGGLKLLQCFVVCWVSFVRWCSESFSTMINVWHSWASEDIPKRAHL